MLFRSKFYLLLEAVKGLELIEKKLISELINICRLLLVNPSTSETGKRSFSTARRIKTWLRAKMSQKRLNGIVAILEHPQLEDTD